MKHRLFIFVAAVLMSRTTFAQFSGSGSGTQSDPYLITNAMQLDQVRNFLGNSNVYFKVMEDIDLQEFITENYPTQGWMPIGTSSSAFQGKFDGNGKIISNLMINRPSKSYVGFFGNINGATISNIAIEGNVIGKNRVGCVVGYGSGNCKLEHIKVIGGIEAIDSIGGLIGSCKEITISNCTSEISIKGNNHVGGLVGNGGSITNVTTSSAIVDIETTGDYCGGAVGSIWNYSNVAVSSCYVSGNIVAQKNVGGIIGYLRGNDSSSGTYTPSVNNTYFHGDLIGTTYVGGICGWSSTGSVGRNYTKASITGTNSVGGIVGYVANKSSLLKNVAINNIVRGSKYVGRIYGQVSSNCTIGEVGSSNTNRALSTTKVFINDEEKICEDNPQHGQSIGSSTLKYKATYQGLGWNFTDIWDITEAESYPYFTWQAAPPNVNIANSGEVFVTGTGTNGVMVNLIINGQSYQTTCNSNVWSISTPPLIAGDTIYAYSTMPEKVESYRILAIVQQAPPVTSLHLSDDASTFATGFYEGGIDYSRVLENTDEYASFCLPFDVKQSENATSFEELYIPLGIALKYADANNEDVLKVLFVATDEVEAGTPFIAKLADAHSTNLSIVSATNEITQGIEASSINIIPYIYDATALGSNAAVPTNGNISWCGTFENLSNQTFYALQTDGGFMYQLNANTNPFRGYLSVSNMPTIKKVIAFVDAQGEATSIEHMFGQDSYAPQKILRNGQIVILRGNKTYTITGAEVK